MIVLPRRNRSFCCHFNLIIFAQNLVWGFINHLIQEFAFQLSVQEMDVYGWRCVVADILHVNLINFGVFTYLRLSFFKSKCLIFSFEIVKSLKSFLHVFCNLVFHIVFEFNQQTLSQKLSCFFIEFELICYYFLNILLST